MKIIYFLERTLPIVFWGLITFGFDTVSMAVLTILCAIIHECGHLIMLTFISSCDISLPRGAIFGFRIHPKRSLSYKEELLVVIGGPLINLFWGLIFLCVPPTEVGVYLRSFGALHILTMISNLLPIEGYDGFKLASCIIALKAKDINKYERILLWISFSLSVIFTFLSLYLILKIGEGYWIFLIFFSSVMSAISRLQKSAISKD